MTTYDYTLQITDSVLSLLQTPLAVSWQRILTENYNSLTELHTPNITYKFFSSEPPVHKWQLLGTNQAENTAPLLL
jgi:hypothetical protein